MRFGLGRLRLPPDHFWSMTPRELSLASQAFANGVGNGLPLARLHDLMTRFPDNSNLVTSNE